jgi:type I restriction enzyme S subunit
MPELHTVRIGDLGRVVTGKTPPSTQPELFGEEYPFLTPTDIDGAARYIEPERFLSPKGYHYQQRLLLPPRSICVVCIGATIGKVCMTNRPSFTNQQINSVLVKEDEYDPFFVYHLLTTLRDELRASAGGAATPIINKTAFSEIEVRVPTLAKQRRIAGILSAYDNLVQNCQRRIKILESMARALYREWFVHFRFPGHEKHTRVTSPLGEIPKGWEVEPVESFCPLVTRGVTPKYETGSGRFIINQKVNRGTELSLTDLKELEGTLDVPPDKFARFGDVLVNCLGEGTIGRVHFYAEGHQDWAVDQHMSICRAANISDSLYVYFAMESKEGQARIASLKTGGTNMTMFNISALRSFALVSPPAVLLSQFAGLVLPMLRQKQTLTELSRNLRRTRDLLLPRLLSGQLELQAA